MLLQDKVAIITGAASGIGLATVELFLEEGAKVIAGDINASDEIQALVQKDKNVVFVKADVTKAEDHQALVDSAVKHFGGLDIAFNNAGISGDAQTLAADQDMALSDKVFEVNMRGVQLAMNAQIKYFLANEVKSPAIINTASIAGNVAIPFSAPYVASKHAVVGLTKAYAVDYARYGIRINMVAPGAIETPILGSIGDEALDQILAAHPIGRMGTSREIGQVVAFLASERATFINGAYYNVDGGYLSQ
jgi:NAD(P)-dependent dehydrogenase (short-subunit alcohol dehydrogenase family)